jgi:hypothetical protein
VEAITIKLTPTTQGAVGATAGCTNGKARPQHPYFAHRRAPADEGLMSPKELKSLMARTHTSSLMLAEIADKGCGHGIRTGVPQ